MTYATQPRPLLRGAFFNAATRCVATLCSVMRLNSTQRFINLLPSRCSALHNIAPLRSAPRHNATFYPFIIAARRRHTVLHRTALCFAARCCASQLNATFYQFITAALHVCAAHYYVARHVALRRSATRRFIHFSAPRCSATQRSNTHRSTAHRNVLFIHYLRFASLRLATKCCAVFRITTQRLPTEDNHHGAHLVRP